MLIVLHESGETTGRHAQALARRGRASTATSSSRRNGTRAGGAYGYSEREHATVLETLRDLRRRFAVDSDRVFLFGLGQGGAMAFDVGLSHPDLFAGVLPMSAGPATVLEAVLPATPSTCRSTSWTATGPATSTNDTCANSSRIWVSKYPTMWIQYKGRGVEWFGGEVPTMFDWMRGQQRAVPDVRTSGVGRPFATQRATDNSFYWADDRRRAESLHQQRSGWNPAIKAATLQARIDLENNTVSLATDGLSQVTVWLGRNGKGEPMVDFARPVTVTWNAQRPSGQDRLVTPSLATLLEDLADRGDRQRLFAAKLEFQGSDATAARAW